MKSLITRPISPDDPRSKPCPRGCPQGMVLEEDPWCTCSQMPACVWEDTLPHEPIGRYRCQDCDQEE